MLALAHATPELEDVPLAVTVGNLAARTLYRRAGFVPYGVEPRSTNVDGRYFDTEWMLLHLRGE